MHYLIQNILPHKALSKFAYACAECKIGFIKNFLISFFLSNHAVNMDDAIIKDPYQYESFNHFFTRELQPGARPLAANADIYSPADGTLVQFGDINNDRMIQAKKHTFSLAALLGEGAVNAKPFKHGQFATIYLAPHNYHRVHMPIDGVLEEMVYVPGRLYSVNQKTSEVIPDLFAKNERVICVFQTKIGKVAVILVGAMIVGSIETTWAGNISPPHYRKIQKWTYPTDNQQHISLRAGEEMGKFLLGSTVIIVTEANKIVWEKEVQLNQEVKYGAALAQFNS